MPRSKKTNEERIAELQVRKENAEEAAKRINAQLKQLQKKEAEAKRKKRTHLLIQLGGVAEKYLNREVEEADIERFARFISRQEQNGRYFTKAMQQDQASQG